MKKKTTETPIFDETKQRLSALVMTSERIGQLKYVLELRNWALIELQQTNTPDTIYTLKALLKKLDNA